MPWAARPNGSAAAPTAGLEALRPLLVLQLFAPARGRAASLDGCALPPLRKLPITGGVGGRPALFVFRDAARSHRRLGGPYTPLPGRRRPSRRGCFGSAERLVLALGDAVAARVRLHKAAPTTPESPRLRGGQPFVRGR